MNKNPNKIYIVDFLNIFSDFREIKYKKNKIDFHNVKHENILTDTSEFFHMFFTKYIHFANIDTVHSNFIFVVKKIPQIELVINNTGIKYPKYNFRFVVIENKFNDNTLDKNKDDFLCQYFFEYFNQINKNCILISNDKYRDLYLYINKVPTFLKINIFKRILEKDNIQIQKSYHTILINPDIKKYIGDILQRCSIPKYKLHHII